MRGWEMKTKKTHKELVVVDAWGICNDIKTACGRRDSAYKNRTYKKTKQWGLVNCNTCLGRKR